jgi:hypothetical protein
MPGDIEAFLIETGRRALVAEECKLEDAAAILCRQGSPLGQPHEGWPHKGDVPLFPILGLHTPELPFVPPFLEGYSYWTFFFELNQYEQGIDDGSLIVRRYRDVTGLELLAAPSSLALLAADESSYPTVQPLRFHEVRDYPSYSALERSLAPDLFQQYRARATELRDRYPCHSRIKLGGYPYLIQEGPAFLRSLDPDFQMQWDSNDYYMYCDTGIGYVFGNLAWVIWETI